MQFQTGTNSDCLKIKKIFVVIPRLVQLSGEEKQRFLKN